MSRRAEDRPEYTWLREFKKAHSRELLEQFGAHSIGIGWKRVAGQKTDQLALIFYVEKKSPVDELVTEPIPPSIAYRPSNSDKPVLLKTDVIETPPARFE